MRRWLLLVSALAGLVSAMPAAHADWYLDNESSRLSFVTTQNLDRADVHRFLVLHGKVDDKGAARLQVELESINSSTPSRDERIRNQVFEADRFPDAVITAQLDVRPISDLANGAQLEMRLPLSVELHGERQKYHALLLATRLDERRFQVVTLEPLVLRAEDFGFAPAIAALRKRMGLDALSLAVPVGAVLIFTAR